MKNENRRLMSFLFPFIFGTAMAFTVTVNVHAQSPLLGLPQDRNRTVEGTVFNPSAPRESRDQSPLFEVPQDRNRTVESKTLNPSSPREVRCRGEARLFNFSNAGPKQDSPGMVTMAINFSFSRTPPGADGKGLEPGTCAWSDRIMGGSDLHQIQFVTSANAQLKQQQHGSSVSAAPDIAERFPDAQSIPTYLEAPNHYWSFMIEGQQYGWYLAGQHNAWKPALKDQVTSRAEEGVTPSRPNSVRDRVLGPKTDRTHSDLFSMRNVRVFPKIGGVVMYFDARHGVSPVVEIHESAPIKEPSTGRWFFPTALTNMSAMPVKSKSTARHSHYLAEHKQLEQGKPYHYLITVPGDKSIPESQHTGAFTTLGMTVKVTFTQIYVLDDSDDDGNGELMFNFYAKSEHYQAYLPERSLPSGARIKPRIEFEITNQSIDRLKILIEGTDNDGGPGGRILTEGVRDGQFDAYYADAKPYVAAGGSIEKNFAKLELDLTRHPGKSASIPFTIRSMPVAGTKARLMFEVSGWVHFTRPDQ